MNPYVSHTEGCERTPHRDTTFAMAASTRAAAAAAPVVPRVIEIRDRASIAELARGAELRDILREIRVTMDEIEGVIVSPVSGDLTRYLRRKFLSSGEDESALSSMRVIVEPDLVIVAGQRLDRGPSVVSKRTFPKDMVFAGRAIEVDRLDVAGKHQRVHVRDDGKHSEELGDEAEIVISRSDLEPSEDSVACTVWEFYRTPLGSHSPVAIDELYGFDANACMAIVQLSDTAPTTRFPLTAAARVRDATGGAHGWMARLVAAMERLRPREAHRRPAFLGSAMESDDTDDE